MEIERTLERVLLNVQKPGRYIGGELNQIKKDWDSVAIHVALVFPDIYDIGMSNLGLAILYDILNRRSDVAAERAYAPWSDMEGVMRTAGIPLYTLESKKPLNAFDIVGFSLPYETLYTNVLNMLDLGGIPLFTAQRDETHPLIIAGGHATYNPEPMADFIDAFVIGEGEEVIEEIITCYQTWKSARASRSELLQALAGIWGVYVPCLYRVEYHTDGAVASIQATTPSAPLPVLKRIVPRLPKPVTRLIVPNIDTIHNRIAIEIMRGCTRGCRFCHAGMITRPVRERSVEEIITAVDEALAWTGFEEVGLLSLSSSDYTHILELVERISTRYQGKNLNISLPSLRIESFSIELMERLKSSRRSGFTLAPEAATERMRNLINKPLPTDQLLETTRQIFQHGWHNLKLYFMIGHPSETIEDVRAIIDLCQTIRREGAKIIGSRAQVTAGVSTFVPKPHTPFQWVPCDRLEHIEAKLAILKHGLRGKGLKLNWNSPENTLLEAWLSRGDRRMAQVIYHAWNRGAKFDAWKEHFRFDLWMEAFQVASLSPDFYTHRERPLDEVFPWEHINASVRKKFLAEDYLWSLRGQTRIDCRQQCFACGILPTFTELRRQNPGEYWQCPEVREKRIPVEEIASMGPVGR